MKKQIIASLLGLTIASSSFAAMVIEGTRVVYKGKDKEVIVRMTNQGQVPLVVQSWVDGGEKDKDKMPEDIQVPFQITPPISRVDPGKGQALRIFYTAGQDLAKDKETLFWFNVLEIPPKAKATEDNTIFFTIRSRLKFFYRPSTIAADIPANVTEKLSFAKAVEGGKSVIKVTNSSPYFITFAQGEFEGGGKLTGGMVPPMESATLTAEKGNLADAKNLKMLYINDSGANIAFDAKLK
jgi:P pilus assembly chaperone PapD